MAMSKDIFRSTNLQQKRPSWCQDLPTTTVGEESGGDGVGWSPRGRSLDLHGVGTWGLSTVEEGTEAREKVGREGRDEEDEYGGQKVKRWESWRQRG